MEEDIQNRFSEYKTYKYKDPLMVVKIKSTKMLWLWDIMWLLVSIYNCKPGDIF